MLPLLIFGVPNERTLCQCNADPGSPCHKIYVATILHRITYDKAKRDQTLAERGLDSGCGRQMHANKRGSRRSVGSDLARVDAHVIQPHEYEDLPELTEAMLATATIKKAGRPRLSNPRQLISLRLPADVIARWRATGPGWQTRMAQRLHSLD